MERVLERGTATAEQVRADMDRDLKDSTVRTVLRRLEEKGYLTHATEDRTYVYRPAEAPAAVAARAVRGIIDRFCKGSVEELLVGMVDGSVVSKDELARLAKKIAKAKEEGK